MNIPYEPISCDFHDVLEVLATRREPARIRFRDERGVVQERTATIRDVFSQAGAEYLLTTDHERLRLDQLVTVEALPSAPRTGR